MSIVWTEKDETGIEALKYLEEHGHNGRIVSAGAKNVMLEFDVTDEWKVTAFLRDLLFNKDIQSITGIRVKQVGYPQKAAADEIKEHIQAISSLLAQFTGEDENFCN